ncbi:hypothetical protein E3N88_37565 [Mikania micrantha]|uniref:Integrase catalytic domain-containing protein n=1 Tax=Mikania micrantha TaxID=192012 RepID=A0A5N6LRI7_9ASTR|nr:hypothetical protein E3N88_37565 [Mikania micrantha]
MQVPSLGGSLYYFLLIDDYTRMNWVYFLKFKSEAFDQFKYFKTMVEKECEKPIKVLRTDRGGEFCSQAFLQFCKNHGIRRELTIPFTPEHNGVAERKNRTIMGLTRSMIKQKQLPNHFWAEGVATAVYLLNRSPTKARPNKTPIEEWGGVKPLFITSGLYCPTTKKFTIQKHVIFNEDGVWTWNNEGTKETLLDRTNFSDPFPATHLDTDSDPTQASTSTSPPVLSHPQIPTCGKCPRGCDVSRITAQGPMPDPLRAFLASIAC